MLAGIIPAPELRSPFNEPSRSVCIEHNSSVSSQAKYNFPISLRGKTSQARALRRRIDAGFIDIEAALSTVNRHLYIHGDVSEHHTKVWYFFSHEDQVAVEPFWSLSTNAGFIDKESAVLRDYYCDKYDEDEDSTLQTSYGTLEETQNKAENEAAQVALTSLCQ
ncbi:hypothetical protein IFM89_023411 [Coptis chinensis]|uniref:Uncharacterized protein n=1 Tax=Coptis chinensis TaxID=261450 RepID=A0A835HSI6_9MAGN|nr:hypothetical protein IFM89_023411 [Coptis chinensis]